MKPIPDIDLSGLFQSAVLNAINDQRQNLDSRIRQILKRQEAVTQQVRKDSRALEKSTERMKKLQSNIDRLKAGDWQVLSDLEKMMKEEEKQKDQRPGAQQPGDEEN